MKPWIEFELKVPETEHHFNVLIFEKREDMIKAKQEFTQEEDGDDLAGAFTCPFEMYKVGEAGIEERGPAIGHLYFYKDKLGSGCVSHEMVHAAMHVERLVHGNKEATFGDGIGETEERFANTLGDLCGIFVEELYNKGAY